MTQPDKTTEKLGGRIHTILNRTITRKLTQKEYSSVIKLISQMMNSTRTEERAKTIEELRQKSLDVLEEHFPKLNQDNPNESSGNGRGEAMAYRALLLTSIITHSSDTEV